MSIEKTSIETLHGIGPALKKRFGLLGITTIHDLLWYIPKTHDDRSMRTPIAQSTAGEKITVQGEITHLMTKKGWRGKKSTTRARIEDESGSLDIIWFNQPYIAKNISVGDTLSLNGMIKKNNFGVMMHSPEYEKILPGKSLTHTGRIVPQYRVAAGITQKQMRFAIQQALEKSLPLQEYIPQEILDEFSLPSLSDAIESIHFPKTNDDFYRAQRRFLFERLYLLQLAIEEIREKNTHEKGISIPFDQKSTQDFVSALPFSLTAAQKKGAWAIIQNMEQSTPMNRLLQGDVGSGKTVVASIAIHQAVHSGYQAVLMAPTEIVARQHYHTLQRFFSSYPYTIALRTGSEKQDVTADIIVGTHALIQSSVAFDRLGLVIIDEQHRFGVAQRKYLKEKTHNGQFFPHLLSMSATPIPRSLALALYGDLDISILDEMPEGRIPIITRCIPQEKRMDAYAFIGERIDAGEQVFIVCPLIENSEKIAAKDVHTEFEYITKEIFPDKRVELLHGKMPAIEKKKIMEKMRDKKIDVLITTSVVEVGVDIPDATVMIIEGAERFGLAQLHQLRGRVGRSKKQSYCFLFQSRNSNAPIERLTALTKSTDGRELAQKDLELRGSGQVYGTMQSGFFPEDIFIAEQEGILQNVKDAVRETKRKKLSKTHNALKKAITKRLSTIHQE